MLKKVLVVDDELLVRMGFQSILDWESCGFTVVGDAANGKEALEKIRLLQPDLVFTDLRMEPMDGFELMKACAAEYSSVRFIVLSSYNDFDNVRQALRCGALDYIFKLDLNPEQLRRFLSDIRWDIPSTRPIDRIEQRAVRSTAVCRIAAGEVTGRELRESFALMFPIVRPGEPFRLINVVIDNDCIKTGNEREIYSQNIVLEMENILSKVMSEYVVICPFQMDSSLLLWQGHGVDGLQQLQDAYVRAEEYIKRYLDRSITAVISDEMPTLDWLPKALTQNDETLSYRYLLNRGRIHSYHRTSSEAELPPPIDMALLEDALRSQDSKKIIQLCDSMFSQVVKRRGYPLRSLRLCLLDTIFAIKRVYPSISTWDVGYSHTLESLVQSFDQLDIVREAFDEALNICLSHVENMPKRPEIISIVRYVRENPAEEMSVSKAAQMTQISESYFAHIFKREMGLSFIDWLNRERVEKARQMLLHTTFRVNEIASSVGISNANYFSILFKKLTGKTPIEIRGEEQKQDSDKLS